MAVAAGTAYQDPLDSATRVLLAEFTPPAVVVDSSLEIVLFCGDSEPYLQHAAGRATLNLLAMAREGLAAPLRSLIERVRHEGRALTQEGATLGGAQEGRRLDISAVPLAGPPQDAHLLLVFAPSPPLPEATSETTPAGRDERRESARLKRELVSTQEYLQSLLAQKDKGNEELRAANEEIQSANEELQSVNEELETTKEELQSTNEELRTINEELESRNGQLAAANDDLSNLLRSMSVPTVVVDRSLAIRRFTPGTEAVLAVIASDVGRPIGDVTNRLTGLDLGALLIDVVENATAIEREACDEAGRWYALRARPFLTAEGHIEGAVLTFLDIDELHRSLEDIRASAMSSESLNRVITSLAASSTSALAMSQVLGEAATSLGADAAAVAVRQDTQWVVAAGHNLPSGALGTQFGDLEFPQAMLAVEARVPVTVNIVDRPRGQARVVTTLNLGSLLVAPLLVAGVVDGVVLFSWQGGPPSVDAAATDFVAKVAALVALAVENERLRRTGSDEPAAKMPQGRGSQTPHTPS